MVKLKKNTADKRVCRDFVLTFLALEFYIFDGISVQFYPFDLKFGKHGPYGSSKVLTKGVCLALLGHRGMRRRAHASVTR